MGGPSPDERGVADRGLTWTAPPPETFESVYDPASKRVVGDVSDKLNELIQAVSDLEVRLPNGDVPNRPIVVFDRLTLRRLIVVGGTVASFQNSTANLLRLADLLDRSLSRDLHDRFRSDFFQLVQLLVDIGDALIGRTRKPYQVTLVGYSNPPLDSRLLGVEPLANYHWWKTLLDSRTGKAFVAAPVPITETRFEVEDDTSWQQALDQIEQSQEALKAQARIAAARKGATPEINGHIQNLKELQFKDIERQTRARFPRWWHDDPLHDHVGLVVYHSVYSILLDQHGNPLRKDGIAPYSLLIPDPGDNLQRLFHPRGLYVSMGPLADYQFSVRGKSVKNLLFGGITGMTRSQSTFTFEHYLQTRLQQYIAHQGFHAVAAIVVDEGFGTPDLTLASIRRALPALIDAVIPFALDELLKRAKQKFENIEAVLLNAGKQFIQNLIEDKIRDWCIAWLVKKIGKKIIPVVNVISAISNLFDKEEQQMLRALLGCVIMVAKSGKRDDMTLCARITAGIAIDKVEEEVMAMLIQKGGRLAGKAVNSGKKADKNKPTEAANDPQADAATTDKEQDKSANKSTDKPAGQPADKSSDKSGQSVDTTKAPPGDAAGQTSHTSDKRQVGQMSQQQLVDAMRAAQQAQLSPPATKPEPASDARPEAKPDSKPPLESADRSEAKPNAQAEDKQRTQQDPPRQRRVQQGEQTAGVRLASDDPETLDRTGARQDPATQRQIPRDQQLQQQQTRIPDADKTTAYKATGDNGTDSKSKDDRTSTHRASDQDTTRDRGSEGRGTNATDRLPVREPPLPPTDMSTADRWRFYDQNIDHYPKHVAKMLASYPRTVTYQRQIDRELRDYHAEQLSHSWGIPIESTSRVPMTSREKAPLPRSNASTKSQWAVYDKNHDHYPPHIQKMIDDSSRDAEGAKRINDAIRDYRVQQPMQDTSGGDWEKTNVSERTGQRPNLQATSTTKSGARVQIDDFDSARRTAIEYKASLEIPGKDPKVADREIKERMERHGEFAEDRNLQSYEWVAHSRDSYVKMTTALAELKEAAQKHPDKAVREKLKARYEKISIVNAPILDK